MKLPVQVTFEGMEPSPAVELAAREKVRKLEQFAHNMLSCRVAVAQLHKHQHQGRPFGVRIDLTLPGRELVVDKTRHEDVYVALRDAFDDMRRQLEQTVRRVRREEKTHAETLHGEVVRLNDSYGFIRSDAGDEYYFSRDNLAGADFDQVGVGAQVRFLADAGGDGPQAKRVTVGH